ncbi:hypothetical protein ONS95_011681 [Cadophora gregata]|uniref:uncharacterized protein n=1 Tax=Cadophora gregata TaxID=51156 RepID=UPI0026DBC690|nr:uncharacterized protein ONS95_011681 [Cadophora gregata]KAK0120275.1 hypothetical protein ONS95_011681 [Cadophora gregata]KAK0121309.1 hypothetical protein ONS96_011484 [Cadophora gregata f. sp. sojae]
MFPHHSPTFTYLLMLLPAITLLISAQQPTPFIPATHLGYGISIPTSTTASSQTAHFFPPLPSAFHLSRTEEAYTASIYSALTSVQSTWTAGSEYPRITAAINAAAPTTLHPSLLASGYNWLEIVTSPWYSSVDASIREEISAQESALQSAFDSMVPAASVDSNSDKDGNGKGGNIGNGGSAKSNGGLGRSDMLILGRASSSGSSWALGMGLGAGFVVGVWLVGGF